MLSSLPRGEERPRPHCSLRTGAASQLEVGAIHSPSRLCGRPLVRHISAALGLAFCFCVVLSFALYLSQPQATSSSPTSCSDAGLCSATRRPCWPWSSLHDNKPCNFTRQPMRAWADLVSASVRACLAKLRECAYDPTLQERTLRKATVQQASALQGLAAMVRRWDDKGPTSSPLPLAWQRRCSRQRRAQMPQLPWATTAGRTSWPCLGGHQLSRGAPARLCRRSAFSFCFSARISARSAQAALSVEPVTYEQKLQGKDADDREPASPDKDAQARTQQDTAAAPDIEAGKEASRETAGGHFKCSWKEAAEDDGQVHRQPGLRQGSQNWRQRGGTGSARPSPGRVQGEGHSF